MVDRIGQQLGNYRLVRKLGRGGFAEVYLGEHIHLGTQAAIKVLHTRLSDDDMKGFLTEARTIAHLEHPHIVRVFEFDVKDGTPFLAMSYASIGTLRQRYPKGTRLPFESILIYVKQVADALQYAHTEKVIHRDVKPENILLDQHNTAMLSDFGIAVIVQSSRNQNTQNMAGTIAYMAPEQIQGKPSPASDQYSLGIVVYEWLCGERPFQGSFTEIYSQQLFVLPPSLQAKVPEIPSAIEDVVFRALAKDPQQRFASVQGFAIALEQAWQQVSSRLVTMNSGFSFPKQPSIPTERIAVISQDQTPLSTNAVTPPSQSLEPMNLSTPSYAPTVLHPSTIESAQSGRPQPSKRHIPRRTFIVGLAGLAGVSAISGGLIWLARSQGSLTFVSSHSTHHSTPTLTPLGTTLITYRGHSDIVDSVTWSPDSKYIASGDAEGTVQVWNTGTGSNIVAYRGHSSSVNTVAWSPDGKFIASAGGNINSPDHTVQVRETTTWTVVFTYSGHSGHLFAVAWSPDGKRIASAGYDSTVQVWDAIHGNTILTYHSPAGLYAVAWSPDGKKLASGSFDKTVQVWDATTGHTFFTYRGHSAQVHSVAWSPDGKKLASGSEDYTSQVWDATTGNTILTYHGHSNGVTSVAWSPDGKKLASGSFDKTVQIWNPAASHTLFTYPGHSDTVWSVKWSPDGKRIASGSADNTVQVWQGV
jgi:eukaryotic-like serine/threonine-protein kinase